MAQRALRTVVVGALHRSQAALATRWITSSPLRLDADDSQRGWVPGWLKSRLPSALGGDRESVQQMENLTLDSFQSSIRQARRLGGLTGFAWNTGQASDTAAQGNLRLFESIIDAMTPEEKANLDRFDSTARQRVASMVGCTLAQVDDCIARYLWVKNMGAKMAQLKREGKPLPTSIEEMERTVGNWRSFKSAGGGETSGVATSGATHPIPAHATSPKDGRPCGLAGYEVSRNTRCPLTKKSYKNCCGKYSNKVV